MDKTVFSTNTQSYPVHKMPRSLSTVGESLLRYSTPLWRYGWTRAATPELGFTTITSQRLSRSPGRRSQEPASPRPPSSRPSRKKLRQIYPSHVRRGHSNQRCRPSRYNRVSTQTFIPSRHSTLSRRSRRAASRCLLPAVAVPSRKIVAFCPAQSPHV